MKFLYIILTFSFYSLVHHVVCLDRQGAARRINNSAGENFKSPCGGREQVSKRVSDCLKPMFELLEGKFSKVPTVDSDFIQHCDKFTFCEKCLRQVAKDCQLNGLHKTALGTFATSTNRFKKQECKNEEARATFKEPMKCIKARGDDVAQLYRNMTTIAEAIKELPISAEEKMIKVCCLLKEIDDQLTYKLNAYCPQQTKRILEIVNGVISDSRSTLCFNPKCNNALNLVVSAKNKATSSQNIMMPIMQILLSLSTE